MDYYSLIACVSKIIEFLFSQKIRHDVLVKTKFSNILLNSAKMKYSSLFVLKFASLAIFLKCSIKFRNYLISKVLPTVYKILLAALSK